VLAVHALTGCFYLTLEDDSDGAIWRIASARLQDIDLTQLRDNLFGLRFRTFSAKRHP
jgi:hypothetical protein